ncbi:hypothetical protein BC332_20836 [Capsicum chinense]|nr:hypothetical protein BC332_20836 [Capsicum chinense]
MAHLTCNVLFIAAAPQVRVPWLCSDPMLLPKIWKDNLILRPVSVSSRLLCIKFYGSFDKPLGRYLLDDLFGQMSFYEYCKEPAEAYVICYTHQQANLTINVRRLPLVNSLPGERDKKIWMWHQCLKYAQIEGVPPVTRRVIMCGSVVAFFRYSPIDLSVRLPLLALEFSGYREQEWLRKEAAEVTRTSDVF